MSIIRFLVQGLVFGIFLSSPLSAIPMTAKDSTNARVYFNSAKVEESSWQREQRYGLSGAVQGPAPFDWGGKENKIGYSLLLNYTPDSDRKSQAVDVRQHFYSFSAMARFSFVALFRFALVAGPGVLWSHTQYSILGTNDSRSQFLPVAHLGLQVDYAISTNWEVSWMALTQYRFAHEHLDWQHGLGIGFNF